MKYRRLPNTKVGQEAPQGLGRPDLCSASISTSSGFPSFGPHLSALRGLWLKAVSVGGIAGSALGCLSVMCSAEGSSKYLHIYAHPGACLH